MAAYFFESVIFLEFKKFTQDKIDEIIPYLSKYISDSCEYTPANILIWFEYYGLEYEIKDNQLFFRTIDKNKPLFFLPIGDDICKGVNMIIDYCKTNDIVPVFFAPESNYFNNFNSKYKDLYSSFELRDNFDYLYKREDLVNLKGKKYHSKRNHISIFDKTYNWVYEDITRENFDEVLEFSKEWYNENKNDSLKAELQGLKKIFNYFDYLGAKGGLIRVDGKIVAYTLGTPINKNVFDINFEKALKNYNGAYTVINREFASRLTTEYINREDDIGIPGLRKAKMSYYPSKLLKKYVCYPKSFLQQSKDLFLNSFNDETKQSADLFVNQFISDGFYYKYVNGEIVSQLFVLKHYFNDKIAGYIYAASTKEEYRKKGYMAKLLEQTKQDYEILFLKPADSKLADYYKKIGFTKPSYIRILSGKANENTVSRNISEITQVQDIRQKIIDGPAFVPDDKCIDYALHEYTAVSDGNNFAYLTVYKDKIIFNELLTVDDPSDFINAVCNKYNIKNYIAQCYDKTGTDFSGLVYAADENDIPENIYLGMLLD